MKQIIQQARKLAIPSKKLQQDKTKVVHYQGESKVFIWCSGHFLNSENHVSNQSTISLF